MEGLNMDTNTYVDAGEAAAILKCTVNYIYKLTCHKKLPHFKPARRKLLIKLDDLQAFVEQTRVPTAQETEGQAARLARAGAKR